MRAQNRTGMEADTGFADRDRILDYLSKQFIGPLEGDDEVLDDKPQHRYLTAILYPMPADSGAPATARTLEHCCRGMPVPGCPKMLAEDRNHYSLPGQATSVY